MDKKNLIIGIAFCLLGILCLVNILREGFTAYFVTGLILFPFVGSAFLRRAKRH